MELTDQFDVAVPVVFWLLLNLTRTPWCTVAAAPLAPSVTLASISQSVCQSLAAQSSGCSSSHLSGLGTSVARMHFGRETATV